MELTYWIFEYIKVLLAYIFLMYVWPSEVFSKILKNKSIAFRYIFCTSTQILVFNTVVLMAGLIKVLNPVVINMLLYGTFIVFYCKNRGASKDTIRLIKNVITGECQTKQFLFIISKGVREYCKRRFKKLLSLYKENMFEYTLLAVILLYSAIYLTYGEFEVVSYGFGDMYVHHSWVYSMVCGKIFPDGVYPAAMHCFLYMLTTSFGIRLYNCVLYLGPIHIMTMLIAAYLFFKEIFRWKYSPAFALVLFIVLKSNCVDEVYGMSRLQWTLPQEFGLYTGFACAWALIRYLKKQDLFIFKEKKTKYCIDENLLIFVLTLAASISIHFYTTIIAFFICVGVAMCNLGKIFNRKHFLPLVSAVVISLVISIMPMGLALVSGYRFQGSIGWAMAVIDGTDTNEGRRQNSENVEVEETTQSQNTGNLSVSSDTEGTGFDNDKSQGISSETVASPSTEIVKAKREPLSAQIKKIVKGIYNEGYRTLYRFMGTVLLCITGFDFILLCGYKIFATVMGYFEYTGYKKVTVNEEILKDIKYNTKKQSAQFDQYAGLIIASIVIMAMYAAPLIGYPELVAGSRLCSTENLLLMGVVIIPIDMFLTLLGYRIEGVYGNILALTSIIIAVAVIMLSGNYHGYLYCEFTRYNGTVNTVRKIVDTFPDKSYTVVSPGDELYQVIQNGWHMELYDFIIWQQHEEMETIPTENVFIIVEKKPMKYAQFLYFTGPGWLAQECYDKLHTSDVSTFDSIIANDISWQYEMTNLGDGVGRFAYTDLGLRTVLESTAYSWCKDFSKIYKNEMKVYYEDEDIICYHLIQNPYSLYDLNLRHGE